MTTDNMSTARKKKLPKFPGFPEVTDEQCGMRLYDRRKLSLVCTHKRDHSDAGQKDVHEMILDGFWWGGWVDRVSEPDDAMQQYPRAKGKR